MEAAHRFAEDHLAAVPRTLTHGDFHLDNVVFVTTGPVVLDWARAGARVAVHDLAELLFSMVAPADVDAVYDAYREALGVELGEVPARLHGDLGVRLLQHFATRTLGIARWLPSSPREERLVAVDRERTRQAMGEWQQRWPDLAAEVLAW